ncbi:MAG: ABC transporter permease subunit [Candidatus Poseidoniia archaeon]
MVFEESVSIEGDESRETDTWDMSLYDQLTSSDGRINRLRFLLLNLALYAVLVLPNLFPDSQTIFRLSYLLAFPALFIWYSLVVKRLQDTGRGSQWKKYTQISVVLSIIFNPLSLILIFSSLEIIGLESSSIVDTILFWLIRFSNLVLVHLMIICLYFSSDFRGNAYGPEDPFLEGLVRKTPPNYSARHMEVIESFVRLYAFLLSVYLFWKYCNKFLGMSLDYISTMARDITIAGTQMNTSYYPMEKLTPIVGGVILLCFLLVQNEMPTLFRGFRKELVDSFKGFIKMFKGAFTGDWEKIAAGFLQWARIVKRDRNWISECSSSIFAIICFVLSYFLLTSVLELTPGAQIPFFFFGGAIVAGVLLLQDNLGEILSWSNIRSFNPREVLGAVVSVGSIILFAGLTLNISMIPAISQNIPQFLSLVIFFTCAFWYLRISREGMKPAIQAKRTAALAYLALLPFILYLLLRVLYLQHDPNPVMQNRWAVNFDFMDKVNTFKINPWPMEVVANFDPRWLFLKAAIINSVRVTLLSIVLCVILGTIVGVTRLSSNKLASTMATVYVEVFRNLPLAVLLFLIATQYGIQAPLFIEERFLFGGAVFFSNQGIWFVTVGSYQRLVMGLVALALLRAGLRSMDRIEPRFIVTPNTPLEHVRRPFSALGWRVEALVADIFLIVAAVVFIDYLVPFVSTHGGGTEALLAMTLIVYALSVTSRVDDDGINSLQIDDSESGLRERFKIWVAAFAVAAGIAVSKGLSWPEYVKDWNGDGVIDAPGSWDIAEGTGFEITPFFLAMMLGLTLFTASTVAEIVRGSIQALPRGQVEAAISVGLNPYQRLRLVIMPQALRSMVPLLNNQFMNVWKNSSLAVIVAYSDIFYVVLVMMNNVGKLIPLFLLLLITYQAGSLAISVVMNWYNSRVTSVKI